MVNTRRGAVPRLMWALVVGLFVGALFTRLAVLFLPDSAAREFLTTSVSASLGPLSVDLIAIALIIGPLTLNLNALSLVGILLVGLVIRSWL
ncbi:MAG TPA: hypothetical protein VMM79_04035 [Longimicrobiales bacterium]|jgi:hypothetical protein|nr:hypothetical protein [Longimicrobiales bacterium]